MAGKASTHYPDGVKPEIGDTVSGLRIGRVSRGIFTWGACPECSSERWVARHVKSKLCMRCAAVRRQLTGERNPRWNGGVRQDANGYRYITVPENHPFLEMAGRVFVRGKYRYYIAEHRMVMAQHLGRPLEAWELVHHLDGIKNHNLIENLELLKCHKEHLPSMNVQRLIREFRTRVASLESRVTQLEAENVLLQSTVGLQGIGNPELSGGNNAP